MRLVLLLGLIPAIACVDTADDGQDGSAPEATDTRSAPGAPPKQPPPSIEPTVEPVPASEKELREYLSARTYEDFSISGPLNPENSGHEFGLVFFNPILEESLRSKSDIHPVGAAAVKELHDGDGILLGWSVSVKVEEDEGTGLGWFWFEVRSTDDFAFPEASGVGVPVCVRCHRTGIDFVHSNLLVLEPELPVTP